MPLNPPPIIENGLILIEQQLLHSAVPRAAIVTYALNGSSTPTLAGLQAALNAFQTAFNAQFGASLDSEVSIEQPTGKMGQGNTTPYEAVAAGAAIVGGATLNIPPPQVAALIKKTTNVGGRANRGRTYMPFYIDQAHINEGGLIDATEVAALNARIATFLNDLTTAGAPMCISNKVYNVPLAPHYVTHINIGPLVSSYLLEPYVATQRRRIRP